MTSTALLAAAAGILMTAGIMICVVALLPRDAHPAKPTTWQRPSILKPRRTGQSFAAVGFGMLTWLVSSWPVAGIIVATAILGLPLLLSTSRVAARGIERLEAIEDWTRRLGDILVVGVGLEQAITTSVRSVPEPIRVEVSALAARLTARWPTEDALRQFAQELSDPTGDFVVAALLLGHRRRGPGLAKALASVADSVAEDVAARRRVEADRAKPRATARAVTLITLVIVGIGALNRTYIEPYGTPLGQLVLLAVTAMFIGALTWMRALTISAAQPRLIATGRQP